MAKPPRSCEGAGFLGESGHFQSAHTVNFGQALEVIKAGGFVAREGWNGKGMYLWLLPAASVPADWCKEPHLKGLAEANGGKMECLPSIRMKTATGEVLTGWLASQSDMFAEDWVEVTPPVLAGQA